ncbi:hypothetical protein Poly24_35190 [Rosistilla carotiformis]|uniref:Glycosyltransferase RgtA/B/C/D-like domain-containing protein n=1 Tax=Rosistilla carotiformis TaxID=2528017 RepID=A0A518JW82_9BACT|nr:glycosyltransferase family 39 protein [Rosistilla carotiformis]QDV69802.1 hypothetical protein Poly24_35190 [Rosistilla carotiformis]
MYLIRPLYVFSAILIVALAARCGAAYWWQARLDRQGQHFAFGDSQSYWTLATQIARGQPYEYGGPEAKIFRVPVYPLMIAPWIDRDDPYRNVLAVRYMGCVLGTLAVAGVMFYAHRLFGANAAACAGALAALHPGAISMSILILSEAPFCPMMVGNLWLWRLAFNAPNPRATLGWSLAAGALSGVAVLARPSWLLFAGFACLFQFLLVPSQFRKTAGMAIGMLIGFAVVMSPWWARSYQITGHFVLTTLQVGPSMYDGLHPGATGASDTGMSFNTEFARQQRLADAVATQLDSTFEYRLNQRMSKAAKTWAMENPGEVLRLAVVKVARTWRPWTSAEEIPGFAIRFASAAGMVIVVVPAAIGLWRYRRRGWDVWMLWVPAIYFTCLHAIFIGSMRYRLPAVFILTILAAPVWATWLRRLMSRDTEPVSN